ncbi:hypothetical protein O181_058034 [Austropuccinia psidii MF-1]|uniref:DNA ligase ATP-dependent N-terminal domain-containing protein n=1 Tax=Austropuccinia psidii MF-1 TaxID=1389203 RepID=A0A9Q3HX88_9BASI|nr:hypothetical protein [Austropuccinia psidii MF-1]
MNLCPMTSAPNHKTRRNDSEGKPNKPAEAKQDDKVMKSLEANHSQDSIHQSSNSIASSNQSDPDRDTEDREAKRIKPSRKNSSEHLKLETNSLNRKKDSLTTKNGADAVSSPKGISKKKLKKVVTEPQDLDDEKPIGTVDGTLKPDNVQDIQTENRREIEEDDEESEELSDLIGELSDQGGVSWEKGKPIPYASLAHTFSLIDGTTKRLEIIKYLSQYLVQVISRTPTELLMVIYLCINRLCPDYEGIELGIGESLLIKAISSSMGRTMAQVKAEFQKVGDLGLVAQTSRSTQKTMFQPKLLTVRSVYQDLKAIATISGHSVGGHMFCFHFSPILIKMYSLYRLKPRKLESSPSF